MTELVNELLTEYPLCSECLQNGLSFFGAGIGFCFVLMFFGGLFFGCLESLFRFINYFHRKRRLTKRIASRYQDTNQ